MSRDLRPFLLLGVAALAAAPPEARSAEGARPVVAIRVGRLFTGRETLAPGVVVFERGKVARVGKDLPAGGIDLPGACATPGWIDAASTTGLEGADSEMTREVTPCVRPLRVFEPGSRASRRALRSGVTSIFLEPGSANVVGGIASVVKTAPGEGGGARVVREAAALKVSLGGDTTSGNFPSRGQPMSIYARRPTTRMGVLAVLRDAWLLGKAAGPENPDADLAAVARVVAGALPVRVHARHAADVRTALEAGKELGFAPILEGLAEGWMATDLIAKAKAPCVVGPLSWPVSGRGPEGAEPALDNAGALHRAGVRIALTAGGEADGLRDQAILAARFGLPRDAVLRAVTSEAAEICGAADRVGSLAPGRDADLVVFDGDPLEPSTRVLLVIVDGAVVFGEAGK